MMTSGDGGLPDEESLKAAKAISELLASLTTDHLLITLISGELSQRIQRYYVLVQRVCRSDTQ